MKKQLLILLIIAGSLNVFAQKNVILKINHRMESSAFAFNQETTNNLGNNFSLQRMEYYLSSIIIIHDSGQTTPVLDLYAIVNAGEPTSILLGAHNVTSIEGITFSVGVNTPQNNDDPAQWPPTHPLALRSPSMHWGWAAGYTFAAIEGKTGSGLSKSFQIHALGNSNYLATTVNTTASEVDNNLEIEIYADYREAIRNIPVVEEIINHGETGEAVTLLENFRDHVFSPTPQLASLNTIDVKTKVSVYPNPSIGEFHIDIPNGLLFDKVIVTDITGKVVLNEVVSPSSSQTLTIDTKGLYFVKLFREENLIGTQKIVIK